MDTKTIDERIREKARKELSDKVHKAALEFKKEIGINGTTDVVQVRCFDGQDCSKPQTAFAYNRELIEQIAKQAIEKLSPKYEEAAIAEFLKKVDSLQEQIHGMYHAIDNQY